MGEREIMKFSLGVQISSYAGWVRPGDLLNSTVPMVNNIVYVNIC